MPKFKDPPPPPPKPVVESKHDAIEDYAVIVNAEPCVAPTPPISMKLIDGRFIVDHQDGTSLTLIISRQSQERNVNSIAIESSYGPYRREMSVNEAHSYADMIHYAASKVTEVLS